MSLLYSIVMDLQPVYLLKLAALAMRGELAGADAFLQEGRDWLALQALAETADYLTERFGGVDPAGYTYGDMRVTSFDGGYGMGVPLKTVPTDGGESTVNVAAGTFFANGEIADQWVSKWGPIERITTEFTEDGTPRAFVNFPMGNIADETSGHFDDQLSDWVEGRYKQMPFQRAEVEAAETRRIELIR